MSVERISELFCRTERRLNEAFFQPPPLSADSHPLTVLVLFPLLFRVVPAYGMVLNSFEVSTAKKDWRGIQFFTHGTTGDVDMHHLELSPGRRSNQVAK